MAYVQGDISGAHMQSVNSAEHSTYSPPQYLPEYLLGDPTSIATSPVHSHRLLSANDSHRAPNVSRLSTSSQYAGGTPLSSSTRFGQSSLPDKHSGPPIQGLFDQSSASPAVLAPTTFPFSNNSLPMAATPNYVDSGSNLTRTVDQFSISNTSSPAQLDPFYTQGESLKSYDELDGTWVTVFGFPPSAMSFILQQFMQYGNILQHKISGGNNWVHLHYQSRIQAKKALSKNGKIFGGNMMIGVTPCIDKNVMANSGKENVLLNSPLSFTLPNESLTVTRTPKTLGMRPLLQAYKVAGSEHEVVSPSTTPQKQNGVVSKAMQYVFGW